MSDKAVLVVLLYMLGSLLFGVALGMFIRIGQERDDKW